MNNVQLLFDNIQDASRITVAVHTHPDGDAIGSGSALVRYLRLLHGKDAVLIVPDPIPDSLSFIVEGDEKGSTMVFSEEEECCKERIAESDLLFCLDCNAFSRTAGLEPYLQAASARKILIDHHLSPDEKSFDLVFSKTEISSASELLYWTLRDMPDINGDASRLPASCAAALMTGMTTDTNNFANSVFPSTLNMASELIAAGVDRDSILSSLYNRYRENRIRLMGYMLGEKLKITSDGVAYMILDAQTQKRFDFERGESEGFVNMPLAIDRVRMSILLTEDTCNYRVSVRSKKGTSANSLANEYFNGGGHELAAGGKLRFPEDIKAPEDAESYIIRVTSAFLNK